MRCISKVAAVRHISRLCQNLVFGIMPIDISRVHGWVGYHFKFGRLDAPWSIAVAFDCSGTYWAEITLPAWTRRHACAHTCCRYEGVHGWVGYHLISRGLRLKSRSSVIFRELFCDFFLFLSRLIFVQSLRQISRKSRSDIMRDLFATY